MSKLETVQSHHESREFWSSALGETLPALGDTLFIAEFTQIRLVPGVGPVGPADLPAPT